MISRGGHVDGPMAGAADVGFAPFLKGLVGTHFFAQIVLLPVFRNQFVAEFVVQAFGGEIALFLSNPFLQTHMGGDDEFGHAAIVIPPALR